MKYYLGVDLGGTNIAAGVVDENYNIVTTDSIPTNVGRSVDEIVKDIIDIAKKVADDANIPMSEFSSIGIGMPSVVNPKTNLIMNSNNFGWTNLPIFDYLSKYTDLPVYIENDANCATLGEALAGAAKDYDNAIMLTLGTGVGGGIIIDKKIYSGADTMGAELGHTKIAYKGEPCTCGKQGCLEAYCSATALINQARRKLQDHQSTLLWELCDKDMKNVNGKRIFEALNKGDELAANIVEEYIDYLVAGISSFVAVFRPEIVILGGGIADAGDVLLNPINEKLKDETYAGEEMGVPKVVRATLGNTAGIIGAAVLENYSKN